MSFGLYKADSKDWLVFILGLFTMLKVRLLGTFGISEIIMIPLFVVTAKNNPFFKNKKGCTAIHVCYTLGVQHRLDRPIAGKHP